MCPQDRASQTDLRSVSSRWSSSGQRGNFVVCQLFLLETAVGVLLCLAVLGLPHYLHSIALTSRTFIALLPRPTPVSPLRLSPRRPQVSAQPTQDARATTPLSDGQDWFFRTSRAASSDIARHDIEQRRQATRVSIIQSSRKGKTTSVDVLSQLPRR